MKTDSDIRHDIDQILQSNYYGEDFEVLAAFRGYAASLTGDERATLARVVGERLARDGSIVDVLLCSAVQVGGADILLAGMLDRESRTSQMTRALIAALAGYPGDTAYRAVERFLDSDQEAQALQTLAAMDFRRTLPALVSAMAKPAFHGVALQCLHEQRKKTGLDGLLAELAASTATRTPEFPAHLAAVLASRHGKYNPFTPDDVRRILAAVAG